MNIEDDIEQLFVTKQILIPKNIVKITILSTMVIKL